MFNIFEVWRCYFWVWPVEICEWIKIYEIPNEGSNVALDLRLIIRSEFLSEILNNVFDFDFCFEFGETIVIRLVTFLKENESFSAEILTIEYNWPYFSFEFIERFLDQLLLWF